MVSLRLPGRVVSVLAKAARSTTGHFPKTGLEGQGGSGRADRRRRAGGGTAGKGAGVRPRVGRLGGGGEPAAWTGRLSLRTVGEAGWRGQGGCTGPTGGLFPGSNGQFVELLTRAVLWMEWEAQWGTGGKPADLGVGVVTAPRTEFSPTHT